MRSLPDRHVAVTAGQDERIVHWDASTGAVLASWDWPARLYRPKRIVIDASASVAWAWTPSPFMPFRIDLTTGAISQAEGRAGSVRDAWPSPDRKLVVVARKRETPTVFQLPELVPVGQLQGWEEGEDAIAGAFDHAGRTLVIADRHDNVIFYDVAAGFRPVDRRAFDWLSGVEQMEAQPGGDLWLFGRRDRVMVWDARRRREVGRWQTQGHPHWIGWTSDGKQATYASRGEVRVADYRTGEVLRRYDPRDDRFRRGDGPLHLFHGTYSRGTEVWDTDRGVRIAQLSERPLHASGVGFLADGRRMAVGTHAGKVELWDLLSGSRELRRFTVGKRPVTSAVGSPDGRYLVAGDDKGVLKVFRLDDGGVDRSFKVSPGPVRQLTFAPSDGLLVQHWDSGVTLSLQTGLKMARDKLLKRRAVSIARDGREAWFDDGDVFVRDPDPARADRPLRIHDFGNEHVYQLQHSASGDHLLARTTEGAIHRLDSVTGKFVARIDPDEVPIESFATSPDGHLLAAVDEQAVVRLYTDDDPKPRLSLFVDDQGEWIAWRSDGAFDASPEGGRYVAWRVGRTVHPVEAFSEIYRVPGLLGRSLRKGAPPVLVRGFDEVFRPPPLVRLHGPAMAETEAERIRVRVEAVDAGGGVSDVRLYHQGRLVGTAGERARGVSVGGTAATPSAPAGPGHLFDVLLEPGDNRLVASAFSDGRIEGRSQALTLKRLGKSVDVGLRIVSIGINQYADPALRLKYAKPDAVAVSAALQAGGKALFRRGIEARLVIDGDATRAGILAALQWLERSTKPEDVAVVFVAAHGEAVDDHYYLLPQDIRFRNLQSLKTQAIPQSDIMAAIRRVPARKVVVLLDTCKSGALADQLAARGAGTRGLAEKRALAVLAKASGVYLIAASTAAQAAVEDSALGHGVFTHALLAALAGAADLDADRAVSVRELVTYVESEVARISQERFQREQFPVTHGTGRNFPLALPQ